LSTDAGIALARVESDGTFGGAATRPFTGTSQVAQLASDGQRTEILYSDSEGQVFAWHVASLARDGAVVSGPKDLGAVIPAGVAVLGEPLVLARANNIGHLQFFTLGADDTPGTALTLASAPAGQVTPALAVSRDAAVAAWIGGDCTGTIHLARILP
jgi:hypothetical protein